MKKIALLLLLLCGTATIMAAFGQGRPSSSGDANGTHTIKGYLKIGKPGYGFKNYSAGSGDSTAGVDTTLLKGRFMTFGDTIKLSMRIDWAVKKSDSATIYYTQYRIDTAKNNLRTSIATKVGGTGSNGSIAIWTGTKTLDVSSLYSDGANYAMGGAVNASYRLSVFGSQYMGGTTSYGNGVAINNASNSGISISTNNGIGMDFTVPGGGYFINMKEGANTLVSVGNTRVLLCSGTDRGTGAVQVTGNISVTGANSSNTYKWEAAAGSAPSNTATPAGWLHVNVAGSAAYLPYYQ